jgi:hypothetical protein
MLSVSQLNFSRLQWLLLKLSAPAGPRNKIGWDMQLSQRHSSDLRAFSMIFKDLRIVHTEKGCWSGLGGWSGHTISKTVRIMFTWNIMEWHQQLPVGSSQW